MSESKERREIELLVEALDAVPDDAEGREAVERLGIDVKSWAAGIRDRVAAAAAEERRRRFAGATAAYETDLAKYGRRAAEPKRSREQQQRLFRELVARVPTAEAVSVNYHKFEEAADEELAEMIRAVRHLLGEDDE